jgi:transglutaminase-like putative cysteine protease
VESVSENETILALTSARLPTGSSESPLDAEALDEALETSPFIQADHPRIIELANEIVADKRDPKRMAHALSKWVDSSVENFPSVGLPSALQVLEQLRGDCNEHTYLYVALARAVELPAKIKVGLVYHKGAFYYHAWPAVYLGEWIEIDPTLGQYTVDATHIALMEGEIKHQLKLARIFGKLKIEILDVDSSAGTESTPDT